MKQEPPGTPPHERPRNPRRSRGKDVNCAPITRGIRSEVEVGPEQGLPVSGVISCDNLLTVPQAALDPAPLGHLEEVKRAQLDRALRYALDIRY
jgi:mRNA interferase MazF